ncbi:MAG: FHA domain-containing protein [Pedococcus sp.]
MTEVRFDTPDQPGWSAITVGGLSALVRAAASDDVVARVVEAAGSGELDDLLDALTRDGVRTAPDFVAVQDGDPVRVVARGTAYAVVPAPGGDLEIRAARRGPWTDEDAPEGATELVLHSGVPLPEPEHVEPKGSAGLPDGRLSSPGGAQGWQVPARLRRGGPPPEQQSGADGANRAEGDHDAEPVVQEVPGYDYLFGAPGSTGAPPFLPNHDTGNLQEPPIGRAPMEEAAGLAPPPKPSDHTLPPPHHTQAGRPLPPRVARPLPARDAPGPAAPAAPRSGSGLIESVPWRRGGSNIAPSGDEAVSPAPAALPTPPAAATPAPAALPTPPAAAAPAAAAPAPATPVPAPGAAAPAANTAAPQHTTPPPADAPEVDEATVDRASLPMTATGSLPRGPIVLAVLCPAGHPSPPHASSCRVCDREIPPQQPFQAPRPPLGTIRLSTGDVVTLDRGVLLGRAPKVNADLPAAQRPHLVRVVSRDNDISRNHVEIVLEGWHVLVRDLGSTNGTTVALPGQQAVRLRPSDSQVIEPGTVVGMADEVSFSYEVPS